MVNRGLTTPSQSCAMDGDSHCYDPPLDDGIKEAVATLSAAGVTTFRSPSKAVRGMPIPNRQSAFTATAAKGSRPLLRRCNPACGLRSFVVCGP